MKKIKVLLADHNESSRASLKDLIELDHDIDVVSEAHNIQESMDKIRNTDPEIALIAFDSKESIGVTQQITLQFPRISVIIISINDEMSYIKQSMLAGAKEFLVKPLLPEELNTCIKKVADLNRQRLKVFKGDTDVFIREKAMPGANNKLVCVYGTKGGVGKSVICTNLAVEMARRYKNKVSLIDLDLQFGDVCILMDLNPRKTVSELMQEGDMIDEELLEDYMYERNGVHVLAPPNKPELSELVTSDGVQKILSLCRDLYTYTFIDTPSFIDETTLTALEMADAVLLVISLDLPTIKNVKKGLDVLKTLKLLPKTRLILNRSSGVAGIEAMDVEKILDMKIKGEVPSDGKLVVSSVNKGIPFVKLNPKAPITKSLLDIINMLENWSSKK